MSVLATFEIIPGERHGRRSVQLFAVMEEPNDFLTITFLQFILDASQRRLPFWKGNRQPLPGAYIATFLHKSSEPFRFAYRNRKKPHPFLYPFPPQSFGPLWNPVISTNCGLTE